MVGSLILASGPGCTLSKLIFEPLCSVLCIDTIQARIQEGKRGSVILNLTPTSRAPELNTQLLGWGCYGIGA